MQVLYKFLHVLIQEFLIKINGVACQGTFPFRDMSLDKLQHRSFSLCKGNIRFSNSFCQPRLWKRERGCYLRNHDSLLLRTFPWCSLHHSPMLSKTLSDWWMTISGPWKHRKNACVVPPPPPPHKKKFFFIFFLYFFKTRLTNYGLSHIFSLRA